jgi:hypothetical protein
MRLDTLDLYVHNDVILSPQFTQHPVNCILT